MEKPRLSQIDRELNRLRKVEPRRPDTRAAIDYWLDARIEHVRPFRAYRAPVIPGTAGVRWDAS